MTASLSLHDVLAARGATFGESEGREIPLSVAGPGAEYAAIREGTGITDRSSWRIFRLSGADVFSVLDETVTAEIGHLAEGVVRPSLLLEEDGSYIADLWLWIQSGAVLVLCRPLHGPAVARVLDGLAGITCEDLSDLDALIAFEGPSSQSLAAAVGGAAVVGLGFLAAMSTQIGGVAVGLARMSVSGENGYLVRCPRAEAATVFAALEAAGEVVLCGEEVTDLLSVEVRAFRSEFDLANGENVLEAGLHWMVGFAKEDYRGRQALMEWVAAGLPRSMMAFVAEGDRVPSSGAALSLNGDEVGYVVRAARSPALGRIVGLAYVHAECAWVGVSCLQDDLEVLLVSSPALRGPQRVAG